MELAPVIMPLPRPEDTEKLGEELGRRIFGGAVVALSGPPGSGKTTLVRGLARGMGIGPDHVVNSPTYTLLQSYPCRKLILHHLDLYRISGAEDAESTGCREVMGREDAVVAVEWAEKEPSILPEGCLRVELRYPGNGEGRVAVITSGGELYRLIQDLPGGTGGGT
jgi:tRNA threonylcarbamoyladenosine biosynthesis protein TsaE